MGTDRTNLKKIALAYSGGLDTSAMLHWLKARYDCQVLAFIADVGQQEDLEAARRKALQTGADRVVVSDLRQEFIEQFIFPALQAHAVYEGEYLLGTSLARPVIAREQVHVALDWGADCVAHGATGKGNDQVRFELTYQALAPQLRILAPWRTWDFRGRADLITYSEQHGIPVTSTAEKPYSIDQNVMHTSFEGGILEDPWQAPPEDIFIRTTSPLEAPDQPEDLVIAFQRGRPVALDGERLDPLALFEQLNRRAGRHGVGRVDLVENRFVGMKSRGVYETPGATVLHKAHRALESIALDREIQHWKDELAPRLAEKIYYGFWFSPETQLWLSAVERTQENVNGEVRLQLYKGQCSVSGRRAETSLYDPEYATFEADRVYSQADAEGFIRLQGLRLRVASLAKARQGQPAVKTEAVPVRGGRD